mmetsp:Transcript_14427/g.18905  ORF Transcript_14427/g.18905 Transcript_14427/m.18905 type:complete len:227 (-) Transcript_14427:707-1387(-)
MDNQHFRVKHIHRVWRVPLWMCVTGAFEVDFRQDERHQLLARPKGLRLEDGRGRHRAGPGLHPHDVVEEMVLRKENVPLRHQVHRQQGVLHNSHDRFVRLGRNNHSGHHHQILAFRLGKKTLGHVKVHLIPIKVSVVGRGHREVHAEGGPVEHLDTMAHNGHLVQGGLPIEHNDVVVLHMPLHHPPVLQVQLVLVPHVPEVNAGAVMADDELGSRVVEGAVLHQRP